MLRTYVQPPDEPGRIAPGAAWARRCSCSIAPGRARFVIVALVALGLTNCTSVPVATPYVGVFTGEFVGGVPLYRLPTIEVVGTRRSADQDSGRLRID